MSIRTFMLPRNQAGTGGDLTLFGLSLVLLEIFNFIFFSIYYRDVNKAGKAFVWASMGIFLYIAAAGICGHAIPFARNGPDMNDPQFLAEKMTVIPPFETFDL